MIEEKRWGHTLTLTLTLTQTLTLTLTLTLVIACSRVAGFQQSSAKIAVSAHDRLRPTPHAVSARTANLRGKGSRGSWPVAGSKKILPCNAVDGLHACNDARWTACRATRSGQYPGVQRAVDGIEAYIQACNAVDGIWACNDYAMLTGSAAASATLRSTLPVRIGVSCP